jgi:hypothetical protein
MTGDQQDMVARLRTIFPTGWFPTPDSDGTTNSPVLDGLLNGMGWIWANLFALLTYADLQARIRTATDAFLDLIAMTFFGTVLLRRPSEADTSYRTRIIEELMRERVTRKGVITVLFDLTGREPIVTEPGNSLDVGSYGENDRLWWGAAYASGTVAGAGSYGSRLANDELPRQFFVTVFLPNGSNGIETGSVSDQDIYDAITSTIPPTRTAWVRITS